MKFRIFQFAFLIGAAFAFFSVSNTFGCLDDTVQYCAETRAPAPVAVVSAQTNTIKGVSAAEPDLVKSKDCIEALCPGGSSAKPLDAAGTWKWIGANQSVWYRMHDGGGLQLNVWVAANGQERIAMEIYPPEQRELTKPIGRGSKDKFQPGYDLFWTGRSNASGIWLAKISNYNDHAVEYVIKYTRSIPSNSNRCNGCHFGGVPWDACVSDGNNWCNDLQGLYNSGGGPVQWDHSVP